MTATLKNRIVVLLALIVAVGAAVLVAHAASTVSRTEQPRTVSLGPGGCCV